ncbi:hypothetical protein [Ktedonospora formicarum]|uniref:Uncharacterized protein n=1 Tax=Ktedonospora formicarum TaxID=2778364 RepID=A0A8J3I9P0_9CHLR|nr:hypothetical protein [Ktedonospora formicarum]GHO48049.1 hypothetical protein KSX_62120 [Ktedonospora formicarum]
MLLAFTVPFCEWLSGSWLPDQDQEGEETVQLLRAASLLFGRPEHGKVKALKLTLLSLLFLSWENYLAV